MDYRKRIYDTFVSSEWQYTHSLSHKEYEHLRKVYHRTFLLFLPRDKNSKIIDLACGAGHFLYFLQKEGYSEARGIDISKEMLDVARRMGVKNVELGDIFQVLPLYKGEFDFVSVNDIIEHLRKDEVLKLLDLVYSALKPGGTALMRTPNAASLFGSRQVFIDFSHETPFTPQSLAQVFRACGFKNVTVYGEQPVAHDVLSSCRVIVWKIAKILLKIYLMIEGTTGFGIWKREVIFEPHIFVVASKPYA